VARHSRIEYAGAIYHPPSFNFGTTSVMNRGDRREPILNDDFDRKRLIIQIG